ncbi:MAG: squalene--hopene cyclase [Verrucomicrobiales bacterium]|nr:squalene--hopene cyclase [Verrucomicrobiales bacterium]
MRIKHLIIFALMGGLVMAAHQARAQRTFVGSTKHLKDVERMYVKGLKALAKSQQPDGSFSGGGRDHYGTQPGVVGLAVVAMLAHGDDPNFGPYSRNITNGINFILKQQNNRTGYIGTSMYNHGFATLALAEAYGTVLDPKNRIGKGLTNAVQLILRAQSVRKSSQYQGGWRYSPESTDSDTTVSGANFVALLAALNAGVKIPKKAVEDGLKYIKNSQSSDGGIGYTTAGGANGPRSAIGALMFCLAKKKRDPAYKRVMDYLYRQPADGGYSHYYHYYLYYASQAFFHGPDPDQWERWNTQNIATLKESQLDDGTWQSNFGTTFATASSLLSMALNYRFLPIYER